MGRSWYFFLLYFIITNNFICAQEDDSIDTLNYTVEKQFYSVKDGLASREVYCVGQDRDGFIWFGTKLGLNRFDGKNFKLFTTKDGLSSNIVSNFFVDENNLLILQHGFQWSPYTSNSKIDVFDPTICKAKPYKKITQQSTTFKKRRWIYNYIDKDIIYKIEYRSTKNFDINQFQFSPDSRIYFMPGSDAKIVYSQNKGLYFLENNNAVKLLDKSELFIGDNGRIDYFFKDVLGNIWICMPQGVYKIKFKRNNFHTHFTNSQQRLYSWPQARGIYVEENEVGNKTIFANIEASLFSNSKSIKQKNITPTWGILIIGNRIYLNGYDLYELDKNNLNVIHFVEWIAPNKDLTTCIYHYSDSILYLGSTNSIIAYNRFSHKYWLLQKKSKEIPEIKDVYRIFTTSKGVTAVAENGIYIIDEGKLADYYGSAKKDVNKHLPIKSILDIHEDENKCLWIATNGFGLVKYEWNKQIEKQKTISYTLQDGLSSMIIYRIEKDDNNNLWLSSDDGIMRFDKKNNQIKVFTSEDGLPHNEFNRTSSYRSRDGWIYFGGLNGVVGFDPNCFNQNNVQQRVPFQIIEIVKHTKDGVNQISWSRNNQHNRIDWLTSDKLIKIDFALLDYESGKNQYAYRILGLESDWNHITNNSISIGSLPFGSYTVEIKAQLKDGTWINNTLKIPIEVIPPFYLKTWFIIFIILFSVALVFIIIWYRGRLLKKQKTKLEKLVSQRTKDLNIALGDKDILLKELHHRVKNNLQIITGLLELQKEKMSDTKAIEALNEGQIRLSSIALIHQNFYSGNNLESISFKTFLTDLLVAVKQLFENEERNIQCFIQSEEISIDISIAIPLGLIVNELLTNSYKYLPKNQPDKNIEIHLNALGNGIYKFIYKDNGLGLPSNINFENSETLGLRLINGLAEQINGSVSYKYQNGSVFIIQFKMV
ncbi:MAG: histidine kinase dimerization/phosphoacceptor domain -containing protein [Bacteroidota bacterium]